MPKRSNEFQKLVYIIHHQLAGTAKVTESAELADPLTVSPREVDILVECETAGYRFKIGVECTSRKRRADVKWVEEMWGKHQNLTHKLILVSESGFTTDAIKKAETYGIESITLSEAVKADWTVIVNKLERAKFALVDTTPERIGVVFSNKRSKEVTSEQIVVDSEGRLRGSLLQNVYAIINRPDVAEPILRALTAKDSVTFDIIQPVPPGTSLVEVNGNKQEIRAIGIQGKSSRRQPSLVELRHVSFKDQDTQIAYGKVHDPEYGGVLSILERKSEPPKFSLYIASEDRIVDGNRPKRKE